MRFGEGISSGSLCDEMVAVGILKEGCMEHSYLSWSMTQSMLLQHILNTLNFYMPNLIYGANQ